MTRYELAWLAIIGTSLAFGAASIAWDALTKRARRNRYRSVRRHGWFREVGSHQHYRVTK